MTSDPAGNAAPETLSDSRAADAFEEAAGKGRALGVDVGQRWTGLAVTDPLRLTARPLTVLDARMPDQGVDAVARIAMQQEAAVVVFGVPVLASGEAGTQAELVLATVARLEPLLDVPVVLWEESYTSAEVAERRRARRAPAAQKRDDAEAAAVLLEEWIAAGQPMDFRPPVRPR